MQLFLKQHDSLPQSGSFARDRLTEYEEISIAALFSRWNFIGSGAVAAQRIKDHIKRS